MANNTRRSQSRESAWATGRHSRPIHRIAAAIGLVLFFIAAIVTHLRGRDYSVGLVIVFLLLALAALVLRVASL